MSFFVRNQLLSAQRLTLLGMHSLAQRMRPQSPKAKHLVTGEQGEFEALFFLRRQGYLVIERRWRTPELRGDIDLIGWDGEFLCFVEVKTRTARDLRPAASAIDDEKRMMLRRMARIYRRAMPGRKGVRVPMRGDVVSVYRMSGKVECELVRGAIGLVEDELRNAGRAYGV